MIVFLLFMSIPLAAVILMALALFFSARYKGYSVIKCVKILLILLIAKAAMASKYSLDDPCSPIFVLHSIRPGASWTISNQDIATLIWDDPSPKPTKSEVDTAISTCQSNQVAKKVETDQAAIDMTNKTKTTDERLDALIKVLGLN